MENTDEFELLQEDDDPNPDEDADQFEGMVDLKPKDIWMSGGAKRNAIIRELIKCFGSMVKSVPKEYSIPDHKGRTKQEDMEFIKLLDASKYVVRAKRALIKNENFDTRDFTIFIAGKNWVRTILRPLLELCAREDSLLAMRCCGLALVLVKRISEKSNAVLKYSMKKKRATKTVDGEILEVENEATETKIANVKEQIAALLSFKEALCSDLCNEAVTNAFKEFWTKEQENSTEDNKTCIAICFSYLRRILAIEGNPRWSTVGDMITNRQVHLKYIVQLKQLLSVIPGICSDIMRPYHTDWLTDILLILYFSMHGFEAKDLLKVWKSGGLLEEFEDLERPEDEAEGVINLVDPLPIKVPEILIKATVQSHSLGVGSLSSKLKEQRMQRGLVATASGIGSNSNRFRSVFRQPLATPLAATNPAPAPTVAAGNDDDAPAAKPVAASIANIIRDPFAANTTVPQAKTKRNKRNLTFSVETTAQVDSNIVTQATAGEDSHKACVVVATLVNLMTDEISLKPLIRRVNEDLRRDEMRVGNDLELRYFEIISKVLHYNRLKLLEQRKQAEVAHSKGINASAPFRWEPNLKNIMDALDRMSFMRVIGAIERLTKGDEHADEVVVPMTLYKEMICYLRILLESDIEGHHDIAVAGLYRLFYANAERVDPMMKLLHSWRPGVYPKNHLSVLVELVHETLKTLEAARDLYKELEKSDEFMAKLKKRKGKKEMDLEYYLISCLRFSVDDYFKRMVSNQTVRMYTKLLANYASNDVSVNHYIYCFFRRMTAFNLEQEVKAPPPVVLTATALAESSAAGANAMTGMERLNQIRQGAVAYEEVHLGFMLFNIQTLMVFSTLMSDEIACKNKALEPLLRLIRAVVRRFMDASSKNHLLFVEILFQHARAQDFCCQLDSVYEAPMYLAGRFIEPMRNSSRYSDDEEEAEGAEKAPKGSGDGDYGDEFDENDTSAAFAASEKVKRKMRKLQKGEPKRKWSAEEDAVLREQYELYANTSSIFATIAQSEAMIAFGKNRSEKAVEKRVKELKLHMEIEFTSSSDEGEKGEAKKTTKNSDDSDGSDSSDDDEKKKSPAAKAMKSDAAVADNDDEDAEEAMQRIRRRKSRLMKIEESTPHSDDDDDVMSMTLESDKEHDAVNRLSAAADDMASPSKLVADGETDVPASKLSSGTPSNDENNVNVAKQLRREEPASHEKKRKLKLVNSAEKAKASATAPAAAWDVSDDEDLLEKRSLALHRASGKKLIKKRRTAATTDADVAAADAVGQAQSDDDMEF